MGASVNLRHIVTNKNKSINNKLLEELFGHALKMRKIQSNISYKLTENYLRIEYFSKSIPSFIYNNSIFNNEDIITIYSSDLGDTDSCIIFNSEWNGDFIYDKCFYEFDQIEITGSSKEIELFQQYLYESKSFIQLTDKWYKSTFGKLFLHTWNNELAFSSGYPNFQLIPDKKKTKPFIQNDSCFISSIECEDSVIDRKLARILSEMFKHPEYYDNKIETVKFCNQDEIIFMAKFDKEKVEWLFFQNNDLWRVISNKKMKVKLKEIAY